MHFLDKLHPNENVPRATREIREWAPEAMVFSPGSAEELIANCDVFITRYSSTVYVALALGKEVHCDLDLRELRELVPDQHGRAAANIADVVSRTAHQQPSSTHPSSLARSEDER